MNKFSCILIALIVFPAFAQRNDNLSKGDRDRIEFSLEREVKGNNFLYDEWNKGDLVIHDSVYSPQNFLKYNAFDDKVLIKESMNADMVEISDIDLTGFSIIEHKLNSTHTYIKLYNKNFLQPDDNEGYYEIVSKLEKSRFLIKKNFKILYDPNKSKGTQAINNVPLEYKLKKHYYLKNNNDLYVKTKLNKKSIRKIFNQHSTEVDKYIKSEKIKFSNEADVVKLAAYYYSL